MKWLCATAILVAAFVAAPALAQSPGSKAVADKVAKQYGVTVLRTKDGKIDGKAVVFVTVPVWPPASRHLLRVIGHRSRVTVFSRIGSCPTRTSLTNARSFSSKR